MTPEKFLDLQADLARRGLRRSLRKIGHEVGAGSAVGQRVREHPWLSLGLGVGAGFLVGRKLRQGHLPFEGALRGMIAPLARSVGVAVRTIVVAALAGSFDGQVE